MNLLKCLKLAFNILRHSRLRSWLSIIGIVIGVASVITIMALGEGMKQTLNERLGGLGSDLITISPGSSRAGGSQASFRGGFGDERSSSGSEQKNLTNKDVQALKLVTNIAYIEGVIEKRVQIKYFDETLSSNAEGVDPKVWKDMEVTPLESGRYLSQGDQNVVVIGSRIAKGRFKQDILLNRQITIEGKPFRVVGILKASSGVMGSSDSGIFMPIDSARVVFDQLGEKDFDSIEIKVRDVNSIDDTLTQIESRLMLERAVNQNTKDFTVNSVKAFQETITSTLNTMSLFLSAIAAISLLVGAIGIANSMFTTVLEKTRDIGIMKAIGARDGDIMSIFLFNSAMIGLSGGLIGGIAGIIGSQLISGLVTGSLIPGVRGASGSMAIVTSQTLLLVLGLSITIGIVSGIIPAYRASKMNPVDALRYE